MWIFNYLIGILVILTIFMATFHTMVSAKIRAGDLKRELIARINSKGQITPFALFLFSLLSLLVVLHFQQLKIDTVEIEKLKGEYAEKLKRND